MKSLKYTECAPSTCYFYKIKYKTRNIYVKNDCVKRCKNSQNQAHKWQC